MLAALLCALLCAPAWTFARQAGQGGTTPAGFNAAYADEAPGLDDTEQPSGGINIIVPNVIGKTLTDAKSILSAAGLTWSVEEGASGSLKVVDQSPYGGATLSQGSTVYLAVEQPQVVEVTDVALGYIDPDTEEYIQHPNETLGQVPLIKTKGGQIQMLATVTWNTGTQGYASDQGVGVTWSTSDPSVATVDPRGVVTAAGDGTARITCDTLDHGTASGYLDVTVIGQDGAYVLDVAVTDVNGNPYGENRTIITSFDGSTAMNFYATVWYSDGTKKSTSAGDAIENLTWSVNNTASAYVNADTGLFRPLHDGSIEVTATVTGGIDGAVSDFAYVVIDTGEYKEGYVPSDTFTVHVLYAADESQEYETRTYTVSSLNALGSTTGVFTLIQRNGRFQTLTAKGVPLALVLADMGLEPSEVSHFYFSAFDFNRQMITASYILDRAGYYFPNYEAGGLTAGAQLAQPMIATEGKVNQDKSDADYSNMDANMRFRLCLGTSGATDMNAQYAFYCLSDMYVVMKGAPQTGSGSGTGGGAGTDGPGSGTGEGESQGGGTGDNPEGIQQGGGADTSAEGESEGQQGEEQSSANNAVLGISNTVNLAASAPEQSEGEQAAAEDQSVESAQSSSGSSRWRVYEMMNNEQSDIDQLEFENPLEPFVVPLALAVIIAGGIASNARMRKELAA